MQTGENEHALRKIIDLTRMLSMGLLMLHLYCEGYGIFRSVGWHTQITDRILMHFQTAGLFYPWRIKTISLLMLFISLLGARGRRSTDINKRSLICQCSGAVLFYALSTFILPARSEPAVILYGLITILSFLVILSAGTKLSRLIKDKLSTNVFNEDNETFPQEERLLKNDYSVNLPATYTYDGKSKKSWINFINPFRGLLIIGSPGAGKSYFIIRHIIEQHLSKGFSMLVYDFKFDDLSLITYNFFLKYRERFAANTKFCTICFDDLSRSHRCNPLEPETMTDISDAAEAARVFLCGLNREWIKKPGDFFCGISYCLFYCHHLVFAQV